MKLCFIIACKVYKNYKSYLPFTIKNINEFYPNSTIILVDNNSKYSEYYNIFKNEQNIILLENTSSCKFELGAYNFATKYIIDNNLGYLEYNNLYVYGIQCIYEDCFLFFYIRN